METSPLTQAKVFIIESLKFENEKREHFEGNIISSILRFADVEHQYHYIRTKAEFEHFVGEFNKSNYRYLHISCHGYKNGIATTLDTIPFKELAFILQNSLDKKRIFMSACSAVNTRLADEIFGVTDCYSIIGPNEEVDIDDAAIFWATFYHLMFKHSKVSMKKDTLRPTVEKIAALHDLPMKYYSNSKSIKGWKEVILRKKNRQ